MLMHTVQVFSVQGGVLLSSMTGLPGILRPTETWATITTLQIGVSGLTSLVHLQPVGHADFFVTI